MATATANQRLRLPPFSRQIQTSGAVSVYVGTDDWSVAQFRPNVLLLPYGDKAADYIWPINGREVTIFDHGAQGTEEIRRLAVELLLCGAICVYAISELYPKEDAHLAVWRPE
jgi:hypothetical protein